MAENELIRRDWERSVRDTTSNRNVGVVEAFEKYWVRGESFQRIGLSNTDVSFQSRSPEDAQRLSNGDVSVEDLWTKYLTDFQIRLAQELSVMRLNDLSDADADVETI